MTSASVTGGESASVTAGESASVTGEGEPWKGCYTDEPILFELVDHAVSGTRV